MMLGRQGSVVVFAAVFVLGHVSSVEARLHPRFKTDPQRSITYGKTSRCTDGQLRSVPHTGCTKYHTCVNHQWYWPQPCNPTLLWNNDANRCVEAYKVDTSTCRTKTSSGGSEHSQTVTASQCGNRPCYYGTCTHHKCVCHHGYEGDMCQELDMPKISCSNAHVACHNGQCVLDTHEVQYKCKCHHGYTGHSCDRPASQPSTAAPTTTTTKATTTTTSTTTHRPTTTTTPKPTTTTTPKPTTTTTIPRPTITTSTTPIPTTTTPKPTITTPKPTSTTTTPRPTPTTTTPRPTTTTTADRPTTTLPTTTTTPLHYKTCKKVTTVLDLGNHVTITNANVTRCPSGNAATPEAFVLGLCDVTEPSSWIQGANVMKQCQNIPLYTPVATFSSQGYVTSGGLSGVFLGCLPNGFKLGVQECDTVPTIKHIDGGLFTMDPTIYFTVQ